MKIVKKLSFLITSLIILSCSKAEEDIIIKPQTILTYSETGLLGQKISFQFDNIEVGKLQVFFDLEKAEIVYISKTEVMATIPRSIKRSNPTLKVIDLNTNSTILNKTFLLKTPLILNYSETNVTFNETISIIGENFDDIKEYLSVYVNDEIAEILNVSYNKIDIKIPTKINNFNLKIKVKAQLQEVTSSLPLILKTPKILNTSNSTWIGSTLIVNGENFNPDYTHGQVYVNNILCYFSATNSQLSINVPPGPYSDFKITNITYKTAELITSFNCDVAILNNGILVDYFNEGGGQHKIFTHNGKAYLFKNANNSVIGSYDYTLLEFSPVTEKWTELTSFQYRGYIHDIVYDGDDTTFIYKRTTTNSDYVLTKLNMNTFNETQINIPFSKKIDSPILFAYQQNFYFLSGRIYNNNTSSTFLSDKYKYSKANDSWSQLDNSTFSELPLVSSVVSGKCDYIHSGNNLYITYDFNKTFQINPDLSTVNYRPYAIYFQYQNAIFGKHGNTNVYLSNMKTGAQIHFDYLQGLGYQTFSLNNEIYYIGGLSTAYYQNTYKTYRLRKSIINGLL